MPLATLTAGESEGLLERTAAQVSKIEPESQRKEIAAYAQLMAGLRFNKKLIYQMFREGMMRESVIYQDILQEGERKGRQEGERKGLQEGERKGLQEGRQEGELMLILRQLTRRVGIIAPDIEAQIRRLSLAQLDRLGEDLLDFSQASDLEGWLRSHF